MITTIASQQASSYDGNKSVQGGVLVLPVAVRTAPGRHGRGVGDCSDAHDPTVGLDLAPGFKV